MLTLLSAFARHRAERFALERRIGSLALRLDEARGHISRLEELLRGAKDVMTTEERALDPRVCTWWLASLTSLQVSEVPEPACRPLATTGQQSAAPQSGSVTWQELPPAARVAASKAEMRSEHAVVPQEVAVPSRDERGSRTGDVALKIQRLRLQCALLHQQASHS